jgi:hypothetical protein
MRRKDVKEPLHLRKGKKVADSIGGWNRGVKEQLRLWKKRTTTKGIGAWTLGQHVLWGSRATQKEPGYESVSVDIATTMTWSIKDWTMWRGRPPPKRLKREPHAELV